MWGAWCRRMSHSSSPPGSSRTHRTGSSAAAGPGSGQEAGMGARGVGQQGRWRRQGALVPAAIVGAQQVNSRLWPPPAQQHVWRVPSLRPQPARTPGAASSSTTASSPALRLPPARLAGGDRARGTYVGGGLVALPALAPVPSCLHGLVVITRRNPRTGTPLLPSLPCGPPPPPPPPPRTCRRAPSSPAAA